ncbi:hypothetical protein CBER1_09209 [Cercospora berteroae]|uniref:AB hydrolase-1 domain-containing protein n=1 Tax=Cercospora berteroae TaxID=357750 RepID=A0A2S6BVP4_9PEZI|nr:hypothetical protein CBER1_09209 [Cercospora berteroae]
MMRIYAPMQSQASWDTQDWLVAPHCDLSRAYDQTTISIITNAIRTTLILVNAMQDQCCFGATNLDSKFTLFRLRLSNGAPNYLNSSGWLVDRNSTDPCTPQWKISPGRTHFEEEAHWFHELIFPAIWEEFGLPNACTSMVTTSHSIGVIPSIIAAGIYAEQDPDARKYPWAGMIVSGLAPESTTETQRLFTMTDGDGGQYESNLLESLNLDIHAHPMSPAGKAKLLLSENCCPPSREELVWKQTTPMLKDEGTGLYGWWQEKCLAFQARVELPVLCALGSADVLFKGTRQNIEKFGAGFVNAASVESSLVYGAPHAIELSYVGNAWYKRCFAWAQEKALGLAIEDFDPPCYD